ncbi:MAG: hypothetical protein Q8Q39_04240 [bacterium]|nr:hypothetical protein [bacterium]
MSSNTYDCHKTAFIKILACAGLFFSLAAHAAAEGDGVLDVPLYPYPQGPQQYEPLAAQVGNSESFFVEPAYDVRSRPSVTATLQFAGARAYLYVENTYLDSLVPDQRAAFLEQGQELVSEFDQRIYPLVTQTYGVPWEPGIDNDVHITILLTQLSEQTAGYFNPRDEFERVYVPGSNEREMIYLNTRFIGGGRAKTFLAHEFQHLISFYWKDKLLGTGDDVWLNELRSEYVPTLLGYDAVYNGSNLEHRVNTFLRQPGDSVTEWTNHPYDYGPIALFGQYLADQYTANIFGEMLRARTTGFQAVEDALRALAKPDSFEDVFANWMIANYLNDISQFARHGYLNSRLRTFGLEPNDVSGAQMEIAFSTKDWANNAWRVFGSSTGVLRIEMQSSDALAAYRLVVLRLENGSYQVQRIDGGVNPAVIELALSPDATYLLLPFSKVKTSTQGFGESEPSRALALRITELAGATQPSPTVTALPSPLPAPAPSATPQPFVPKYPDGALLRAIGDYKVYVTKGQFKRHIVSPDIFAFYGHFGFMHVIDVSPQDLDQYKLSAWVRADGDPRVWEINGDGTKHWINIPGEQFAPSGRSWDGVYIINARERDWYVRGADVMR